MKAVVNLLPVVTEELLLKLGHQGTDYEFKYDSSFRTIPLTTESVSGQEHLQTSLFLKDGLETWSSATHNLRIKKTITLQNPSLLFGPTGVAGKDSEIGVAVMWASKQANQRGIFRGDSIRFDTVQREFTVMGEIPKGVLRDRFHLNTVLYLKETGTIQAEERHLAQKSGIILGYLGKEITIHLKGNGSIFPIFSLKEDGPLWRVECNWDDVRSDSFDDENIRIILNENHPNYSLIESADRKQISPLMREIIASAIQIIIEKAKTEVSLHEIVEGRDIERGSVGMAIQYFIQAFNLDISSPESIAYSLRAQLDRKTGGIV
jgi:hypothetical protein